LDSHRQMLNVAVTMFGLWTIVTMFVAVTM